MTWTHHLHSYVLHHQPPPWCRNNNDYNVTAQEPRFLFSTSFTHCMFLTQPQEPLIKYIYKVFQRWDREWGTSGTRQREVTWHHHPLSFTCNIWSLYHHQQTRLNQSGGEMSQMYNMHHHPTKSRWTNYSHLTRTITFDWRPLSQDQPTCAREVVFF